MALFAFEQITESGDVAEFVFELVDVEKIREAREILKSDTIKNHVSGKIIAKKKAYNPHWSFHLDPESVEFFALQMEVCDANVSYVESHLSEVGSDFLPRGFWCPWSSRLKREI